MPQTLPIYLAPVRGVSDLIYRNALHRHIGGIDQAITPFLTVVKGCELKATQILEVLPENNDLPSIPQIIGNNPQHFVTLAKTLADVGIQEINWNLGCPHRTMTQKRRGAGLLPHALQIEQFLEEVTQQAPTRLSVKVRLGLNNNDDLDQLIPIFNRFPITELIIHPRNGKQMYSGSVDLAGFERAYHQAKMPIVYNGDIFTVEDYLQIVNRFPKISKIMLGRGLFQNPFLAQEINGKAPSAKSHRLKQLKAFHDQLLTDYQQRLSGDAHLLQKLLGHWIYLAHAFKEPKRVIRQIKKCNSLPAYQSLIQTLFI